MPPGEEEPGGPGAGASQWRGAGAGGSWVARAPPASEWLAWSPILPNPRDTCRSTTGSCSASCSPGSCYRCRWWWACSRGQYFLINFRLKTPIFLLFGKILTPACSRTRFGMSSTRTSAPSSSSSDSWAPRRRCRWSRRRRPRRRREGRRDRLGSLGR